MNLPPHLQNLGGMIFPNSNNIQLNPNNLSSQSGVTLNQNIFQDEFNKIQGNRYI